MLCFMFYNIRTMEVPWEGQSGLRYPRAKPPGDPQAAGSFLKNNKRGNCNEVIGIPCGVPDSFWMTKLDLWVEGKHRVMGIRPSFCPQQDQPLWHHLWQTQVKLPLKSIGRKIPPVPASNMCWSSGICLTCRWRRWLRLDFQNVTHPSTLPASRQNPGSGGSETPAKPRAAWSFCRLRSGTELRAETGINNSNLSNTQNICNSRQSSVPVLICLLSIKSELRLVIKGRR